MDDLYNILPFTENFCAYTDIAGEDLSAFKRYMYTHPYGAPGKCCLSIERKTLYCNITSCIFYSRCSITSCYVMHILFMSVDRKSWGPKSIHRRE